MPKRVALLALFCAWPGRAWAQFPLGPEFQVNTYTTGNQRQPAVASDEQGAFVVVWDGRGPDGEAFGIFGQRYDAGGAAEGPTFTVNSYTTVGHGAAAAARHDGGFVVVYHRSFDDPAFSFGVFGRRYDTGGAPLGGEFRVSTYTTGYQGRPAAAADRDGNFVVVWTSTGQDGSGGGVFAQRFAASGLRQGPEFRVNSLTAGDQSSPAVASDPDGNALIVWESFGQDGADLGVFAQRYDASGAAQGGEFQVNVYTTSAQARPVAAATAGGGFVVAWQSSGQDGSGYGVFGRRYDASGAAQGGEFPVNAHTVGTQREPAVATDPAGGFTVVWHGESQGSFGVFGQLYDADGARVGREFPVNSHATGNQQIASVASGADGAYAVAWQSDGQDGAGTAVIGRRFNPDIFRDGFESGLRTWSTVPFDDDFVFAHPDAALRSTSLGLLVLVEPMAGLYVHDDRPEDEGRYRARFYFDPNGFDPGEEMNHRRIRLFVAFEEGPNRRLMAIVLRRLNGQYGLMGRARLDDNSQHDTGFFPISDGPHVVEVDWQRASAPGAGDGSFALWIDGVAVHAAATLDNGRSAVDFVRLGALSVKAGASGQIYCDEFVSRRSTAIGP